MLVLTLITTDCGKSHRPFQYSGFSVEEELCNTFTIIMPLASCCEELWENEVLCTALSVSPGPEPAFQDLSSLTMRNIRLLYDTTTQTHTTRRVQAASCSNQPALHSFHSLTIPEMSCESFVCLVVLQSGKYQ